MAFWLKKPVGWMSAFSSSLGHGQVVGGAAVLAEERRGHLVHLLVGALRRQDRGDQALERVREPERHVGVGVGLLEAPDQHREHAARSARFDRAQLRAGRHVSPRVRRAELRERHGPQLGVELRAELRGDLDQRLDVARPRCGSSRCTTAGRSVRRAPRWSSRRALRAGARSSGVGSARSRYSSRPADVIAREIAGHDTGST